MCANDTAEHQSICQIRILHSAKNFFKRNSYFSKSTEKAVKINIRAM